MIMLSEKFLRFDHEKDRYCYSEEKEFSYFNTTETHKKKQDEKNL